MSYNFVCLGDGQTVHCKSSPLSAVEYGDWVCRTDNIELGSVDGPVENGTMCELQCDHRHSIASGHYEVTCTQNGWQNHPDQVLYFSLLRDIIM